MTRKRTAAQKKQKIFPGDGDPRHGTMNGYTNLNCRCEECKEWQAGYHRSRTGGTTPRNPGRYNVVRSTGNGRKTSDMLKLEQQLGLD